jgi:hypothetical protein
LGAGWAETLTGLAEQHDCLNYLVVVITWLVKYSTLPACCHACVVAAGDQLALVEFASAEQTGTALSLNGMKLGDTHTLQVGL